MGQLILQSPYLCRYYYGHAKFDSVIQLQEKLNELEPTSMLEVDGYFGCQTEETVKRYQESHGLLVDGIVGPETLGCMNSDEGYGPRTMPTLLGCELSNRDNIEDTGYISEEINVPIYKIGPPISISGNNQIIRKSLELFKGIQSFYEKYVYILLKSVVDSFAISQQINEEIDKLNKIKIDLVANRSMLISSFFEAKMKIIDSIRDDFLSNDEMVENSKLLKRANENIRQYYKDFDYRVEINKKLNWLRNIPNFTGKIKNISEIKAVKILSSALEPFDFAYSGVQLLLLQKSYLEGSISLDEYLNAAYKFYDKVIKYIITLITTLIISYIVALLVVVITGIAIDAAIIGIIMGVVAIIVGIIFAIIDYICDQTYGKKDVNNGREYLSQMALKWACQNF